MAVVRYGRRALEDVLRLTRFLFREDPRSAVATAGLIREALAVLEHHPLIGRPVEGTELRELVISRGRSGYLALYTYNAPSDEITVLALKHQREAGFEEE